MSLDSRNLENELYKPVRELCEKYSIDDPQLAREIEGTVSNFIEKHPEFASLVNDIYNMAIAHMHGYFVGKITERSKLEVIKIGLDGAKLLLNAYLKYKELIIREREVEMGKR